MPSEMVPQIPFIHDLVPKLGLHGVALPDTEADDLMASYCCTAHGQGMEVILATNDKDLLSLVEDDILVYSTAKADLPSPNEFFTLLGTRGDLQEMGCAAAVHPRRAGAQRRRQRQHSPAWPASARKPPRRSSRTPARWTQLLADVDAIKNEKLRAKITDARAQIVQNREMVRLDADLPVPVPLDELVIAPRYEELIAALEWCEFRSMLAEVRAEVPNEPGSLRRMRARRIGEKPAVVQDDLFPF